MKPMTTLLFPPLQYTVRPSSAVCVCFFVAVWVPRRSRIRNCFRIVVRAKFKRGGHGLSFFFLNKRTQHKKMKRRRKKKHLLEERIGPILLLLGGIQKICCCHCWKEEEYCWVLLASTPSASNRFLTRGKQTNRVSAFRGSASASASLSLSLSLLSYNGIKTTNKRWCYFFSHCSSSKAPQIVKLCLVKFPLASGLV